MQIPRATYRFQFNEQFRLNDALALVPYLHALGISHIYASPLFKAAPHSAHGYDVCDFTQINPEIGTETDLEKLVLALREKKMGLVLDIVPNHMGIGTPENVWWWDVLTNGKKSQFADFFDINWKSSDENLHGKILVPILGDEYKTIVNQGEIQLVSENGKFLLAYHEHRFPLAPRSVAKLPRDESALKKFNSDFVALDKLIGKQNYLLAFHKIGDAKLNYRRFFAVSSLAAVRVENEKIFHATHALLKKWIDRGWLDGIRVDHPDGLRDPQKYLERLRALAPNTWIVVEKILGSDKSLPSSWPVQGTTGYDFMNRVNELFVDAANGKKLTDFYSEFTGEPTDYPALVRQKKRDVLNSLFVAESQRLADLLANVASRRLKGKKFSADQLQDALAETIACFPVYRSYVSERNGATDADIAMVKAATHCAFQERDDLPPEIFSFIHALLLTPQLSVAARNFVARFQQLTGAVTAKGVEDTAFYCFNRFISLNEVGGDAEKFGASLEEFHDSLAQQKKLWPHSQLATSTHDTKRAEDVRARLNVLSEIPEIWREKILHWSKLNEPFRQNDFPDRNAEFLFYQTLVGAWPISEARAQAYMEKAAHESKQHTTWTEHNELYENALKDFIAKSLKNTEFIGDLTQFVETLAEAAIVNSLAQTLIKLTAPGVPDIYQGCELLDLSLVDPDNRRAVDFESRKKLLAEIEKFSIEEIWQKRAEGWPKMFLIQKVLNLRAQISGFENLEYQLLFARGARAENIVAFSRGQKWITIVPRFFFTVKNDWADTTLELPAGIWRDEFSGEIFEGILRLENLFKKFPVTLLTRKEN